MPKLELDGDYSKRFLFNPKPVTEDLTAADQEALVSHWATEIENDPSKLEQLASQVIREQKAQDAAQKTVEVQPQAGFVCKTKTTTPMRGFPAGSKVFINICHAPQIPEPAPTATEEDIQKALRAEEGASYQVPMSLGATRYDRDHADKSCIVVDACVHTQPYVRAEHDLDYRLYVLELAMELVEAREKVHLSREFTMPNLASKGSIPKRMLHVPKGSLVTALPEQKTSPFSRSEMYMENGRLVIAVTLSPVEAKAVKVDVQAKRVIFTLDNRNHTTAFPKPVDVNSPYNTATFHEQSNHLVLRLQVKS